MSIHISLHDVKSITITKSLSLGSPLEAYATKTREILIKHNDASGKPQTTKLDIFHDADIKIIDESEPDEPVDTEAEAELKSEIMIERNVAKHENLNCQLDAMIRGNWAYDARTI